MKLLNGKGQNLAVILAASAWMAVFPCGIPQAAEAAVVGSSAAYTDDIFARFENGEEMSFRDKAEATLFLEEYLLQYRMYDIRTDTYSVVRYDDHVLLPFPDEGKYDRDCLEESIRKQFGDLEGNTSLERITDMCRRLNEKMVYDTDFAAAAMPWSLETGRGVCWHFVKIAAVLLRESGVPVTVVHGLLDGESHVWLQCRMEDGTIVNVDSEEGILNAAQMRHLTITPYISR